MQNVNIGLKGAWLKLPRVATEMDVTKESESSILCNQLVRNNDMWQSLFGSRKTLLLTGIIYVLGIKQLLY